MTNDEREAFDAALTLVKYCESNEDSCAGCIFCNEDKDECTLGNPPSYMVRVKNLISVVREGS